MNELLQSEKQEIENSLQDNTNAKQQKKGVPTTFRQTKFCTRAPALGLLFQLFPCPACCSSVKDSSKFLRSTCGERLLDLLRRIPTW